MLGAINFGSGELDVMVRPKDKVNLLERILSSFIKGYDASRKRRIRKNSIKLEDLVKFDWNLQNVAAIAAFNRECFSMASIQTEGCARPYLRRPKRFSPPEALTGIGQIAYHYMALSPKTPFTCAQTTIPPPMPHIQPGSGSRSRITKTYSLSCAM